MSYRIADVPQRDQPRERLARVGPASMTDAELVALVVRSGMTGRSALEVGQNILATAGGVSAMASLPVEELAGLPAMGLAKASSLVAAFELGRRAAEEVPRSKLTIRGPEDIAAVARRELSDPSREELVIIVLSSRHRVVKVTRLTLGTSDRCLWSVRDIFTTVLRHGGAAFAIVHSHPSGEAIPSTEDRYVTRQLLNAADQMGVRFLGHLILAGSGWSEVDP